MDETSKEKNDSAEQTDSPDPRIFLCDASAEAGRLLNALQVKGYITFDVPLGLLPKRTLYEVPQLVICDAGASEAPLRLKEMRDATVGNIAVLLIGPAALRESLPREFLDTGTLYLDRPIDLEATLQTIAELIGEPRQRPHRPRSNSHQKAPSLVASARKPYRTDSRPPLPRIPQLPDRLDGGESMRSVEPPSSRSILPGELPRPQFESTRPRKSGGASSAPPGSERFQLSAETQLTLGEGKKRVASYPQQAARPIRLPMAASTRNDNVSHEFLVALEEPLHDGIEEIQPSGESPVGTSPGRQSSNEKTGAGAAESLGPGAPFRARGQGEMTSEQGSEIISEDEKTNPGGKFPTQPPASPQKALGTNNGTSPPPFDDLSDLLAGSDRSPPFDAVEPDHLSVTVAPPSRKGEGRNQATVGQPPSQPTLQQNAVLPDPSSSRKGATKLTAISELAVAIRKRLSGAVAQQEEGGIRRIVLTDGDISTVTSSIANESLAHFLHNRGDYTEELLASLTSIPKFGRHAGAALIARGLLQQEDLWPILRSHAEWILGRALLSSQPTQFEETVPARLLEEPAVFGGAAGTEIFIETVRRVVSPAIALSSLGGKGSFLGHGAHETLLSESALTPHDQQLVRDSVGKPLNDLSKGEPDLMPVLLGFVALGVLSQGGDESVSVPSADKEQRSQQMDEEAFVARISARRALVDDGDYFEVLGISRAATGYEVDRAQAELLREYAEETLTPRLIHLREDLQLLRSIVEEAHLVLRDDVRRMRYRSALEAVPA